MHLSYLKEVNAQLFRDKASFNDRNVMMLKLSQDLMSQLDSEKREVARLRVSNDGLKSDLKTVDDLERRMAEFVSSFQNGGISESSFDFLRKAVASFLGVVKKPFEDRCRYEELGRAYNFVCKQNKEMRTSFDDLDRTLCKYGLVVNTKECSVSVNDFVNFRALVSETGSTV